MNDPTLIEDLRDLTVVAPAGDAGTLGLAAPPVLDLDGLLEIACDSLVEAGWASLSVLPYLSAELITALRNEVELLDNSDAMKVAGIGRGEDLVQDRSIRRDRIAWLEGHTDAQATLFQLLERIRHELNRRLFLGLKRFEAHYATYHPGDFYRTHLDSFQGRASRIVSLVLYLNDTWGEGDGGELQLYDRDLPGQACARVLPEGGRMVMFMSEEIPHEVLIAGRTRYSLACWFRRDEIPLPL
ncbi:MAG: 2OG-Fe(II) oxygenase [Marinobacter sp.]|uniref:2OG-Fe(II) oxygenase n=1 Tax=Marinobacter sp. TaxID=50741 RepID=UPI00299E4435|nr:2OG-Fe(II) oxygenase [Marinobacter sp.]MDX1634496.1 2OG-Fe(II) oxygenase [Marinobacter sp.]